MVQFSNIHTTLFLGIEIIHNTGKPIKQVGFQIIRQYDVKIPA